MLIRDLRLQLRVVTRIHAVDRGPDDGDGLAVVLHGGDVRRAIDSGSQPAHDNAALLGENSREFRSASETRGGSLPRTHDGDSGVPTQQFNVARVIELRRRVQRLERIKSAEGIGGADGANVVAQRGTAS